MKDRPWIVPIGTLNARLFTLAHETLTAAGFRHYETSNYSTPGHHSRHNLSYWEGRDYLGLGPSAVSTLSNPNEPNEQAFTTRWKNEPLGTKSSSAKRKNWPPLCRP